MPSSVNIEYMGDPIYNQKALFALTTVAVERGMDQSIVSTARGKAKSVARAPKDYSAALVTILTTSSDLTPESTDEDFIAAVREAWPLFED